MSDMKCPVCGKQMKLGTLYQDDSMGTVWMSIMPCDCVCSYGASKAVWQELIRTRKVLDVACGALKEISLNYQNGLDKPVAPAKWFSIATDMCDYADNAIEQITVLEQKDK